MTRAIDLPSTHIIETARCRLRAAGETDIPHIFAATRFPGFNDGMGWEAPETPGELLAPLAKSRRAWAEGKSFTFSIVLRTDDTFLGRISIRQASMTPMTGVWNLGYFLHPLHQHRGYMRESACAILSFGFECLQAVEIEAYCATWNQASQRVLESIGMRFVEHVPQGFMKKGAWVAENRMAISRMQRQASISGA